MVDWNNWQDSTHIWDLFPKGHPEHDKGFGDILYNAAMLVSGAYFSKLPEFPQLLEDFKSGVQLRVGNNGFLFRDPRVDTPMDIDQIKVLLLPLRLAGFSKEFCRKHVEKFRDVPWYVRPHHENSYDRQLGEKPPWFRRYWGDLYEIGDSVIDWFSDSESSQSKNIFRQTVGEDFFPTPLLSASIKTLELKVNRYEALKKFYTRDWLPHQCPIHLAWKPRLEK